MGGTLLSRWFMTEHSSLRNDANIQLVIVHQRVKVQIMHRVGKKLYLENNQRTDNDQSRKLNIHVVQNHLASHPHLVSLVAFLSWEI